MMQEFLWEIVSIIFFDKYFMFNTHNSLRAEAFIRMRHSKKILSMQH